VSARVVLLQKATSSAAYVDDFNFHAA